MKLTRWTRFLLIPLVIAAVGVMAAGCAKSNTTTATQVTYKVQKGVVALNITAVGNVNYSDENKLSFDTNGTLSEVDVVAGDTVKKGDILAKLDLTGYQQNLTTLQEQLAGKNVALAQAELQLSQQEQAVVKAQNDLVTAQNNLAADQYAVTKAQHGLDQAKATAAMTIAQDQLDLKQAQYNFDANTGGTFGSDKLALAKQKLANDQVSTQTNVQDAENTLSSAQAKVTGDQAALQTAQNGITNAQKSLEIQQMNLSNAQQSAADAQENFDDANATSPQITAPIDGLITTVNTTAGQEIFKGQTIVTLVDPNKFEVNVSVGESNIPDIKVGGNAVIQFDALSGVTLEGKISTIAPTSTTTQGVVSYAVTVDVVSLVNSAAGVPGSGQGLPPSGAPPSGQFPSGGMPSGGPPAGFTPPAGFSPPSGQGPPSGGTPGAGTGSIASGQTVNLRQGMTATVTITYESVQNVLVVPNAAISRSAGKVTVKVKNGTGTTETSIQTGLSNSTMTAVTSGVKEGDEIVYTRTANSSSGSSSQFGGGGGFMMGGGGGPPGGGPP